MAYCADTDVIENLKGIVIDANSAVTTTALDNMITQVSAMIDAYIQTEYALPITSTKSLDFLKMICIDISVYRVTKVLQAKNALPAPDIRVTQEISHGSAYKESMGTLHDLKNGKIQLPDENKKTQNQFSSTAVNNAEEYVFKHSEQQW